MTFKDLFQDVEDWFWKLEFNPESNSYELFLGIPNDWIYSGNGKDVSIDLVHQMENNSLIKISSPDDSLTIDDIIETAKLLVAKNKELERKKEAHRLEMERLKELMIEKEKNFLTYIDTVKDTKGEGIIEGTSDGASDGVNDGASDGVNDEEVVVEEPDNETVNNFMKDIQKSK